jgi:hypothetical protein
LCFAGHSRSGDPLSHAGIATPQPVPPAPSSATSSTATNSAFEPHRSSVRAFLLSDVPEFGHSFLSFPDFLWAHRSGNSSPLRPTRLLLCRFRPQQHWVPSNNGDASLRLHAPSLSVVPPRKTGQKEKVKTKCPIYMLSGIAFSAVRSPTVPSLEHGLSSLAAPGTEACDAVGGAFRPQ